TPHISPHFPYTTLFRSYRRVEIGHKSVSLAQLDREENGAKQADLSFVNKLKKSVSCLSGKKIDLAVEVENHSLRDDINNKLDERSEEHTSELQSPDHLV